MNILTLLTENGIKFDRYDHPPVTTVGEAMEHLFDLPGIKIKNLLFEDKTKNLHLILAQVDTKVQVNKIIKNAKQASSTILKDYFKIENGAVCPFIALSDIDKRLSIYIDSKLVNNLNNLLMFHPARNDISIIITADDLIKFMSAYGYEMNVFSQ